MCYALLPNFPCLPACFLTPAVVQTTHRSCYSFLVVEERITFFEKPILLWMSISCFRVNYQTMSSGFACCCLVWLGHNSRNCNLWWDLYVSFVAIKYWWSKICVHDLILTTVHGNLSVKCSIIVLIKIVFRKKIKKKKPAISRGWVETVGMSRRNNKSSNCSWELSVCISYNSYAFVFFRRWYEWRRHASSSHEHVSGIC